VGIESFESGRDVVSHWREDVVKITHVLGHRMKELLAPVVRIWFPTEKPSLLKSIDHACDCTAGQAGDRSQCAAGPHSTFTQQIETFVIRRPQTEPLCDRVMKQHGGGAVSPHELPSDLLNHLVLVLTLKSHDRLLCRDQ